MKNFFACIRSLPNQERYVVLVGTGIAGAAGAIYACYLLFGHLVIGAAYTNSLFWEPSAELQYYLSRADERAFQLFLLPLLAGAVLGVIALISVLRKTTSLFDALSAFWRGLPWAQKITIMVLCTVVFVGHVVERNRRLFPFVRWGMYASRYEPARMQEFEIYGVTQAGERVHINIGRILSPIRRGAPQRFSQRVQRLEKTGAATDALVLEQVASSVASLYAELNGTTFTSVEVIKEIVYRDAPGKYRRSSHLFRTIPLRHATIRNVEGPAFLP